ncbi:MAG: hypothetical protein ABI898_06540 [Sphingomonadales bacterium]
MSNALQIFSDARSNVLDAFADLESATLRFLGRHLADPGCTTAPLGQKLTKIGDVKAGPQFSKKKKADLNRAAEAFQTALSVRADLVHSRQHVVNTTEPMALYVNASQQLCQYPIARVMTLHQHELLVEEATQLAKLLA